jgi:hypothetical protein
MHLTHVHRPDMGTVLLERRFDRVGLTAAVSQALSKLYWRSPRGGGR